MRYLYIIALLIFSGYLQAQSKFSSAYSILEIPASGLATSLGSNPITCTDSNINLLNVNPALLNKAFDNQLSLSYSNIAPGIGLGYIAYGYDLKDKGTMGIGLEYLNYGSNIMRDVWGTNIGNINGADYNLNVAWSKPLMKYLNIGLNTKMIYSKIFEYESLALAFDVGLTYNNPKYLFTISLVGKNIGNQVISYVDGKKDDLPLDYQFGISKKLMHAPFRFSIVAYKLNKLNLLITNKNQVQPNNTDLPAEQLETDYLNSNSEKIMRHLIFGVEFIPSKKFQVRLGYNYYRRSTMKMIENSGMVGFSFGTSLYIKGYYFGYSRAYYHIAGAVNNFSIRTNLNRFTRK